MKKRIAVFFAMLSAHAHMWAGTCSLCRETLRQTGSANLILGYYWSILLLVSVPLCFLVWAIRQGWRRY